jgi:hypothetical protein
MNLFRTENHNKWFWFLVYFGIILTIFRVELASASTNPFWWGISTSSYQTEDENSQFKTDWDRQLVQGNESWCEPWRGVASKLCGVGNGVPNRMDRLKSIGNAVVPQVVEVIGKAIQRAHVLCAERLPDIKEARPTVRRKPPAQQPQVAKRAKAEPWAYRSATVR